MDTTDRNDSHLPARLPVSSSHLPAMAAARPTYEVATANSAVQISPQGVLRGLARNWWKILLIWGAVSAPLVWLLYVQVQPTYEAYSRILAEPTREGLFIERPTAGNTDSHERYIETQKQTILNDRVLKTAIADPDVAELDFIKNTTTPITDLKKQLQVRSNGKTYYIDVLFESTNPYESATIVNSVVRSYLKFNSEYQGGTNIKLVTGLQDYLKDLKLKKTALEKELLAIVDKGLIDTARLTPAPADRNRRSADEKQNDSASAPPTRDVTLEQYREYKAKIFDKEFELKMLEFELQRRLAEPQGQESEMGLGLTADQLKERIEEVFISDPEIASLRSDILAAQDEMEHSRTVARRDSDPARQAARKRYEQLKTTYDQHWRKDYDKIRESVLASLAAAAAGSEPTSTNTLTEAELESRIKSAKQELATRNELFQSMEIEQKTTQSDTYRADQLKADIETLRDQHEQINRKLDDVNFMTNQGAARVELIDSAQVLRAPTNNKRLKYILVAPCAILALVLGLFALLEVKAERVADPDSLSTRVQSEVFSLPPLPMARAANKLSGPGEDDQIDRFIQRLDHLRFAICGDSPDVGLGRCVLITSAIGGEGKTTLAAQLAARCGHAAHTTLLIDADLRRGSLCPLLDVPEGLGLSDVLKDEANVEDVVIPVQEGTFHLLGAGTPVADASRLFQGRNFGMLIARLRQMYDLIIIDSPPVLPVPDGLILGRWTDGAVLASRYDVSRAPQVERARRQLNNAGIPVLGTVINGMRSSDSYYGRYSYSRGRTGPGDHDESPTS